MAAIGLLVDDIPRAGDEQATIGKYTLLEPLGGGGMGVVYRAWQSDLKRYVALKTIPGGRNMTLASKQRFFQESEALARMDHPNIVPIYDAGEHEGQPYLVMEYVRGNTLTAMAPELLAFPRKSAGLVRTTAEAVAWAHKKASFTGTSNHPT
jgi:eukaryotic-like serine/threonine-protein kinase